MICSSATRRALLVLSFGWLAILATTDARTGGAIQQKDDASITLDILAAADEAFGSTGKSPKRKAVAADNIKATTPHDKKAARTAVVDAGSTEGTNMSPTISADKSARDLGYKKKRKKKVKRGKSNKSTRSDSRRYVSDDYSGSESDSKDYYDDDHYDDDQYDSDESDDSDYSIDGCTLNDFRRGRRGCRDPSKWSKLRSRLNNRLGSKGAKSGRWDSVGSRSAKGSKGGRHPAPSPPSSRTYEPTYEGTRGDDDDDDDDDDVDPSGRRVVRRILQQFYDEMCGSRWIENEGWGDSDVDHCAWIGIVCDQSGNVIQIDMTFNNLSGDCSSGDGDLSNTRLDRIRSLTSIRLGGNAFRFNPSQEPNPLPPQRIPNWDYSRLERLTELDMFGNGLTGPIPSAIREAESIISLMLNDNELSGRVPTRTLSRLQFLTKLNLGKNFLSGTIFEDGRLCRNTVQEDGYLGIFVTDCTPDSNGNFPGPGYVDCRCCTKCTPRAVPLPA